MITLSMLISRHEKIILSLAHSMWQHSLQNTTRSTTMKNPWSLIGPFFRGRFIDEWFGACAVRESSTHVGKIWFVGKHSNNNV